MKQDSNSPISHPSEKPASEEVAAAVCVMTFNANDPSGAGGLTGDTAAIEAARVIGRRCAVFLGDRKG